MNETPNTVEDALAIVGDGFLVLPVELAQRVCTLLGVPSDAPRLPIVSWKDGDEAWNTYGLAGREGPGEGVESVTLSYYVAVHFGIDPAPGAAFREQRLTSGKQANANMTANREALLERGVQGPAVLPNRLIPTGWGTYPLQDEMLIGTERTPAELEVLLERGFFADRKIRSTSGAAILTGSSGRDRSRVHLSPATTQSGSTTRRRADGRRWRSVARSSRSAMSGPLTWPPGTGFTWRGRVKSRREENHSHPTGRARRTLRRAPFVN